MKYIITLFILFTCTFFAFSLLFAEHSTLFYIDLVIACVSELIFVSNVTVLTNDNILSLRNAVGSVCLNSCAILLIIWMLVYNLAMKDDYSIEIYGVGILVVIGVCVMYGFLTTSTASVAEAKQVSVDSIIEGKKNYKSEISDYAFKTQRAMNKIGITPEIVKAYKIACDKASSLPAYVLDRRKEDINDVILQMSDILDMCNADNNNQSLSENLKDKIEELTFNIKNLK